MSEDQLDSVLAHASGFHELRLAAMGLSVSAGQIVSSLTHTQRAAVAALCAYPALHYLGVQRSRIADLMRGQISRFSVDMLITLAGRVGLAAVSLKIAA